MLFQVKKNHRYTVSQKMCKLWCNLVPKWRIELW